MNAQRKNFKPPFKATHRAAEMSDGGYGSIGLPTYRGSSGRLELDGRLAVDHELALWFVHTNNYARMRGCFLAPLDATISQLQWWSKTVFSASEAVKDFTPVTQLPSFTFPRLPTPSTYRPFADEDIDPRVETGNYGHLTFSTYCASGLRELSVILTGLVYNNRQQAMWLVGDKENLTQPFGCFIAPLTAPVNLLKWWCRVVADANDILAGLSHVPR